MDRVRLIKRVDSGRLAQIPRSTEISPRSVDVGGRDHVNQLDDSDETALHGAAAFGHEDIVRLLLDRGAEVDQTDGNEFHTALMVAANKGHLAVVRLLLEHGANPNAADDYGETVLARAASAGHLGAVRLLLRAGAQSSTPGELGKRPHELARENGHPEVAAELLGALGAETCPKLG